MKTVTTFEKADYELLEAAKMLAERIYVVADAESDMESAADGALNALDLLLYKMRQCAVEEVCAPCAGDCGECHCEGCIEDEPTAIEPEVLHSIITGVMSAFAEHERAEAEKESTEPVVTTPKGADLVKALAEIFGA